MGVLYIQACPDEFETSRYSICGGYLPIKLIFKVFYDTYVINPVEPRLSYVGI